MKAVRFHQYGGPEVLQYEDVPDAKPRRIRCWCGSRRAR